MRKSDTGFNGVNKHYGKYSAHLYHAGYNWRLGSYDAPEHAAWVVDFAKYMLLGMNPAKWHPNVARPNFPPGYRDDFPRALAIQHILEKGIMIPAILEQRLKMYDDYLNEREAVAETA